MQRVQTALETLALELRDQPTMSRERLYERAKALLGIAESYVEGQITRNVFLSEPSVGGAP
jgi:hypothetical protein